MQTLTYSVAVNLNEVVRGLKYCGTIKITIPESNVVKSLSFDVTDPCDDAMHLVVYDQITDHKILDVHNGADNHPSIQALTAVQFVLFAVVGAAITKALERLEKARENPLIVGLTQAALARGGYVSAGDVSTFDGEFSNPDSAQNFLLACQ